MNATRRRMLCGVLLVAGLVQMSIAFSRSLIPVSFDGRVEAVEVVEETGSRLHRVVVDGRTFETDDERVAALSAGTPVHKDAWSSSLSVGGRRTISLRPGVEVFQFLALTIVTVAVAVWVTRRPKVEVR